MTSGMENTGQAAGSAVVGRHDERALRRPGCSNSVGVTPYPL